MRARIRKRGEPRDAAKRRQRQQQQHRFRRRERKRSETSSCVIISIHNIHVFFATVFPIERCVVLERREYAHKTFFADPFFSLFFSFSFFFLFYDVQTTTTTTAYFNAETGTTNWEEMWRQEDGEETQPKFDCRRTGESIIILASFFFSVSRKEHTSSLLLP